MTNLIQLIRSFQDEMNIYIHIDKKSKEIDVSKLEQLNMKHLHIIKKYSISWGSYNHLLAIIELMKMAVSNKKNEYIHIISGQDYKIRNNKYYFKKN